MAFASTIKKQYDLPVFEWLKVAPLSAAAVSALTASQKTDGSNRYIYYPAVAALYRYDTYSDSWTVLASMGDTPTTVLAAEYLPQWGFQGRVIAQGSTTSKTRVPSLTGNTLLGYVIEIVDGKGKGQTRTITAVSDPTIHDMGYATGGSVTSVTDTTGGSLRKVWRPNMWNDYSLRIVNGAGVGQIRRILYNTHQVLTVADYNWAAQDANFYGPFTVTPAAGTLYQIESCEITVNTAWTTEPDHTSRFNVRSGAIMVFSGRATPQWQIWHYYSCLEDVWYQRSACINLWDVTAAQGTDCSIAAQYPLSDANGVANGTCTSGANGAQADYTLSVTGAGWTVGSFRNLCVTVTNPSDGRTQTRRILANIADKLWVTEKWETAPTGTYTYIIHPATDKVWVTGGSVSMLYRYDMDDDLWLVSQMYECGVARGMSIQKRENSRNVGRAFAIASATRVAAGVATVAVGAGGSGYRVDEQLTVSTGSANALVRVTAVDTAGAVTAVTLDAAGDSYTAGTKATTGGSGSSATITITVAAVATATTVIPTMFQVGDTITVAGDTSAGTYYNVTDATIIGVTSALAIQYVVNASCAASATFNAQSSTVLYDYAKTWTVNEHANKMLIIYAIQSGNQLVTTQARKIASNTANSITVTGSITAAVTGTSRYAIVDSRQFGTQCSFGGDDSRSGLISVATGIDGGATAKTSLRDTAKSWPLNFWKDGAARKVRILTGPLFGTEITVASNSANTLYWSAQGSEVDANTVYAIYDNYGWATGGSVSTLVDANQYWVTNQHGGKRIKITGVNTDTTNAGDEVAITGVTSPSTLTVAPTASPVAGTHYSVLNMPLYGGGQNLEWIAHRSTGDGVTLDKSKCARSLILMRGMGSASFFRFDITRGIWELINPTPISVVFNSGAAFTYDHMDRCYIMPDNTAGRFFYLDLNANRIEQAGQIPIGFGSAVQGCRFRLIETADGVKWLYFCRPSDTLFHRMMCIA